MILLVTIFAVLAAALAAQAAMLTDKLRIAREELEASQRPLLPPPPASPPLAPRQFECRIERSGLLWFPVLTAKDDEKVVVGVSSGLPHCPRCVRALKLVPGRVETWSCAGCEASHAGMAADLMATDQVLADCLREFFARHPDYAPAPGLSAPRYEPAASVDAQLVLGEAAAALPS